MSKNLKNSATSLMQTTPLLRLFARNIREDVKHVEIAKQHDLPLFEVVSGNTTLDLTRFFKDANKLFERYNTVRMYKVRNGFKTLYRVKKNGRILLGDLEQLGQVGI